MSESNNNIPMRITQLPEATSYTDGMYYAVASASGGTEKINSEFPTLADVKINNTLEKVINNNIIFESPYVEVTDTSYNYALKKYYSLERDFAVNDIIRIKVDSVENNKSASYLVLDLYHDNTLIRSVANNSPLNLTYFVTQSDYNAGLNKIDFIFYPTKGTKLDAPAKIKNVRVIDGYDEEDINGTFLQNELDTKANESFLIQTKSKNLFDSSWMVGSLNGSGQIVDNDNSCARLTDFIMLPKGVYKVTFNKVSTDIKYLYLYRYNGDTFINYIQLSGVNVKDGSIIEFSLPQDGKIMIACSIYGSGKTQTFFNLIIPTQIQLEKGYFSTDYVNYKTYALGTDEFRLKDYYFENNYILSKINSINDMLLGMSSNSLKFVFITDEHIDYGNQGQSIPLINYIKKHANINLLVNGGDTADTTFGTIQNINLFKECFSGKILNVVGNHEYEQSKTDAMINNMISTDDLICFGNPERNYYYIDIPYKKIKLIVLNAYRYNQGLGYEEAQRTWLTNQLENLESEWKAVIFTHFLYSVLMSDNTIDLPERSEEIVNILDSYREKVVAVFQGHTHKDRIVFTPQGIPVIITTCDKNKVWYDSSHNPDINPVVDRTSGTIHEQAFDVVGVDIDNKKITCVRIGGLAQDGIGNDQGELVETRVIEWT